MGFPNPSIAGEAARKAIAGDAPPSHANRQALDDEELRAAGQQIPLGRLGTAEEMANGILTLCDPRHEYMTGATLLIDGGISLPWWAQRGSALAP